MAGGVINLGQVAFVDKGVYSSSVTYKRFNFIVTDDSCYLSLKDGNIGHAITDSTWWKCLAKGSQATEAAKKALEATNKALEAVQKAEAAIVQATQQAANANSAQVVPMPPLTQPTASFLKLKRNFPTFGNFFRKSELPQKPHKTLMTLFRRLMVSMCLPEYPQHLLFKKRLMLS